MLAASTPPRPPSRPAGSSRRRRRRRGPPRAAAGAPCGPARGRRRAARARASSPARMRLDRYCSAFDASGVAQGWKSTSSSSIDQPSAGPQRPDHVPQGRVAVGRRGPARAGRGRGRTSRRAARRARRRGGAPRTVRAPSPRPRRGRSPAPDRSAPTRSASHVGVDGPPPPTSQQRHPAPTPSASRWRRVTGSNSVSSGSGLVGARRGRGGRAGRRVASWRHWTTALRRCRGEALPIWCRRVDPRVGRVVKASSSPASEPSLRQSAMTWKNATEPAP